MCVAAFFILTYQTVVDMVGSSTALEESLGLIVPWVWILLTLLSMAVGIITLKGKG